ncbi:uncharacterized protein LOC123321863 isoform X2 [Coccinella septempunctata]|uniref:uncharacterized protein LOC123321863 isoform X2 n=1 Tax=Coccinella septempunctata TaxID=41139 RepID=UPI001D071FD2|nr:uncharacterized protein LOC123321863 isoform X2 [Coccinella septempunctata]
MAQVDAAEKEASEVLHSLLSVERIESKEGIIVDTGDDNQSTTNTYQTAQTKNAENGENEATLQWHTPVQLGTHSLFSTIDGHSHFTHTMDDHQVIWGGTSLQVEPEHKYNVNTIYTTTQVIENEENLEEPSPKIQNHIRSTNIKNKNPPKINIKKTPLKKKKKVEPIESVANDPTKLEESSAQVKERFKRGCECQDESCFRGLNPDNVYRHRLNIAELTKGEHDMYLMGVTMACLANPDTTVRHKERRRLRAQYVYQGRRVCLDAFLYLENCTHYQLKRIRKHVMTHGVAPRIHGNHGKKPHNTFPLNIYRHATDFLKQYLEQHTGDRDIVNTKQPIQLPWDVTRKNLHDAYKEYSQILDPGTKLMGYSTFRHFMKEQFPHVKFCKIEPKASNNSQNNQQHQVQQNQTQQINTQHSVPKQQTIQTIEIPRDQQIRKCIINDEIQQVIPLVVAPNDGSATQHHQQAFLVTPVQQLIPNNNISTEHSANHTSASTFSYQLTNTGYVINEQGNIVTTMANSQHQTPYTFNRM